MEEDNNLIAREEKSHNIEATFSNPVGSTSKISSNDLSPDSTIGIENAVSNSEPIDPYLDRNKVNGDCSVEGLVPSPSSLPSNDNNNTSLCKILSEKDSTVNENSFIENIDDISSHDVQKKGVTTAEEDHFTESIVREESKNLISSFQEKLNDPHENELEDSKSTEVAADHEDETSEKPSSISIMNDVSSTLDVGIPSEKNDVLKDENKQVCKTRKSSTDNSSVLSNKDDTFKTPRCEQKTSTSKVKSSESILEVCQRSSDTSVKGAEKPSRNHKRKIDDKYNASDSDSSEIDKCPIQYRGFKKKFIIDESNEKRVNMRWNPFSPTCKPNRKSGKCVPSRLPVGDELDCSALQQSEYAQYLGLQPILKFKCSNCGSSAFQSMVALNTHQLECTKVGKGKLDKPPPCLPNPLGEPKSTNIKLTRKVFLCSACGTYYEHWNLFLHMREVHRRYICLYCLGMFSIADKLSEHIIQKHKITHQNFNNLDDFQKHCYQAFYLLCLTCDKVFSEMDDFYGHMCTSNKKSVDTGDSSSKSEATANQECNVISNELPSTSNNKTSTKKSKETSKKSTITTRSSQLKKEEAIMGNVTQKTDDICGSVVNKEDNPNDIIDDSLETSKNCLNENNQSDPIEPNSEVDLKSTEGEQEVKVQESLVILENATVDKTKSMRKGKAITKKVAAKRKKPKDKEEPSEASIPKIKKKIEDEPSKETNAFIPEENVDLVPTPEVENSNVAEEEVSNMAMSSKTLIEEPKPDVSEECKEEAVHVPECDKSQTVQEELPEVPKDESLNHTATTANTVESKSKLQANLLKFKLPGMESEGESDDSQKLSLVVDENANSDSEVKVPIKSGENSATESDVAEAEPVEVKGADNVHNEGMNPDVTLASEDVAVMALTLDDKIENIPIQTVLKECVRTSCMSCNYCRHAVKIAVNGKQLALHILSEHRYMPIKNDTPDDVINKLKTSLEPLQSMFFNTETYDSSDPSIHVPYDQDSSFDCFQCNYVTSSHRDLFAHKRKSHTKSLLLCIMCKSNFYSYSELLCHLCPGTYNAEIQFHNVDINFRCCFCRLDTIPSAFRLMVHLRKTHHTCDICLENGVDQQKLSTHMWKHKLNHLCYRCGIAYASKPDITKHLFWKHGHESVLCKKCLQKKWPHVYHFCIPPTSFICEECNTSFSKAVALKVHKRIHGNDYPYSCNECSKKFVSKKLLQRHEERHLAIKNNVDLKESEVRPEEEQKEEIINVSDVINENKESSSAADLSDSKEAETKDKSHKKHKKDKDKKDKQVVDVYDLPPLNLSSESDSSDEDTHINENTSHGVDKKEENLVTEEKNEKIESLDNAESNNVSSNISNTELKDTDNNSINSPSLEGGSVALTSEPLEKESDSDKLEGIENGSAKDKCETNEVDVSNSNVLMEQSSNLEPAPEKDDTVNSKEVEDIWKNFYSTNPQNSNLPYPLCAIKSEIALGIILGDHDYCHQPIIEHPELREEIPSTSGLSSVPLINDQLQEITEPHQEKITNDVPVVKDTISVSSPVSSPKKKPKSPKKKTLKGGENDNNTSSSSDSSSDSSSSSCSCGPNCSCSSSSSNSSSSSSSDSESSAGEEGTKQERKRKKRERRSKTKSDHEPELPKEQAQQEIEAILPLEPVDPPIRESELETDETTTDEEFYDQQPQRIANQLLAEKRNQLMLLASAANVNNGNASPSPIVDVLPPEIMSPAKQKVKTKRKRKIIAKGKASSEKSLSNSHSYPQYQTDNDPVSKPDPQYHHSNPLPQADPKVLPFVVQATPALSETPGSGSETEKSRSSKRRRIPNKFYGYSSGDEEEKPTPSPKWRKQEPVIQPPRVQQPVHPPTPRIQLTVPKQVIRKPYKFQKSAPPKPQASSSDSTDSGSELENQRSSLVPPVNPEAPTPTTSQKTDKDVYCYCRCPYDEVSEMIACDDENCEIEWFHFECVGILVPPRGQWFCPGCRKARGLPT